MTASCDYYIKLSIGLNLSNLSMSVTGPRYNINSIRKLNEIDLQTAKEGDESTSWHNKYKSSSYIFIGGLDYRLTEGDVIIVFSQWGEPIDIHLVRDKKTGVSKGFCFLAYEDQRSTNLAVDNANGMQLLARSLRVDHTLEYRPPEEEEEKTTTKEEEEKKKRDGSKSEVKTERERNQNDLEVDQQVESKRRTKTKWREETDRMNLDHQRRSSQQEHEQETNWRRRKQNRSSSEQADHKEDHKNREQTRRNSTTTQQRAEKESTISVNTQGTSINPPDELVQSTTTNTTTSTTTATNALKKLYTPTGAEGKGLGVFGALQSTKFFRP